MTYKLTSVLLTLGTIITLSNVVSVAKADEWNKETVVTFGGPVQVPGKDLPAGTYIFKLAGSDLTRSVVEVFTKDRQHLVTSFIAVPNTRIWATHTPVVTLDQETAGTYQAVRSWFYPGDTQGFQFVYRK